VGAIENLAVFTAWTDAENRHDLSHHGDYLHDYIEVHQPGSQLVVGIDAYVANLRALYEALDGFSFVFDDKFATDDRVVARYRFRGTHTGDFAGIPATGKQIECAGMSLWEFDRGKARVGWTFADFASLMAQLQG
jgi:steroid delta-isomerase-like uncharacterized protein